MTPNGTLLAHSQPTDINDLRKQAAVAAITWQEHERQDPKGPLDDGMRESGENQEPRKALHAVSIESESSNVLMRRIQKQLLLVLEGGVPPRRAGFRPTVTAETEDGEQQRAFQESSSDGASIMSNASTVTANILKIQRTKLDTLAEAIMSDFKQTGFQMPEDPSTTIF